MSERDTASTVPRDQEIMAGDQKRPGETSRETGGDSEMTLIKTTDAGLKTHLSNTHVLLPLLLLLILFHTARMWLVIIAMKDFLYRVQTGCSRHRAGSGAEGDQSACPVL